MRILQLLIPAIVTAIEMFLCRITFIFDNERHTFIHIPAVVINTVVITLLMFLNLGVIQ